MHTALPIASVVVIVGLCVGLGLQTRTVATLEAESENARAILAQSTQRDFESMREVERLRAENMKLQAKLEKITGEARSIGTEDPHPPEAQQDR